MAIFKLEMGATIGNQVQNLVTFAEYEVPDEIIREYRTFVETGVAAVLAKASVISLKNADQNITGLLDKTAEVSGEILK